MRFPVRHIAFSISRPAPATSEALASHCRQLVIWAENSPENFENRVALVRAEIARVEGRALDAEHFYENAIFRRTQTASSLMRPSPTSSPLISIWRGVSRRSPICTCGTPGTLTLVGELLVR